MDPGSTPPWPHLRADSQRGRISIWRLLPLEPFCEFRIWVCSLFHYFFVNMTISLVLYLFTLQSVYLFAIQSPIGFSIYLVAIAFFSANRCFVIMYLLVFCLPWTLCFSFHVPFAMQATYRRRISDILLPWLHKNVSITRRKCTVSPGMFCFI